MSLNSGDPDEIVIVSTDATVINSSKGILFAEYC